MLFILLANVASTWAMFGLIWFVQLVHYPLFAEISAEDFPSYEQRHKVWTTVVVAPLMLTELGTSIALYVWRPESLNSWLVGAGLGLVILNWLSTIFLQVPAHHALTQEFTTKQHNKLVKTNWLRTIAWSIRGVLVLVMLQQMWSYQS